MHSKYDYNLHPLSKKLLSSTYKDHYRKPQLVKIQFVVQSQKIHLQNDSCACGRGIRKTTRARGPGSLWWDCLLGRSEAITIIYHQHNYLIMSWTEATTAAKPMWCERKLKRPPPYTKNYRQLRNDGSGRKSLPQGGGHQLIIQNQTIMPKNIHTNNITHVVKILFRNAYVYSYNNNWWEKNPCICKRTRKVIWESLEKGKREMI